MGDTLAFLHLISKTIMKTSIAAIALLLITSLSQASDCPELKQNPVSIGDSWTFKRVFQGGHTSDARILFKITGQAGDNKYKVQTLTGVVNGLLPTAWRNAGTADMDSCMNDFFGGGSLGILDSCNTTFTAGMDWTTEESDKGVKTTQRYQVIGQEEVTVGGGSFMATKIEGEWDVAKGAGSGKSSAKSGAPRHHVIYWYAPGAKTMVKTEREVRNAAGVVTLRTTDELESFRVQRPN